MARVNVHLPVSAWLATVRSLPPAGVSHEEAVTALDQVRAESGDDWPAGRASHVAGVVTA